MKIFYTLALMTSLCYAVLMGMDAADWRSSAMSLKARLTATQAELTEAKTENLWFREMWVGTSGLAAALEEVGSMPYDRRYLNCYDHSKLLVAALAKRNMTSSIMVNSDRSHAWVAVWVEANTGRFVPTDNKFGKLLEVRDPKLSVICSN